MKSVTIRELRNHGGAVVDRVETGEHLIVTRDGRAVAELRPVRSRGVPAVTLLERWRRLPTVDAGRLRRQIDALIEPDPVSDPRRVSSTPAEARSQRPSRF
jgi:prevent-host-death family protein